MICWQSLLKRSIVAACVIAGVTAQPEAALALPGVGVIAGAGAQFADTGLAYNVNAAVDAMGFGVRGLYWMQPSTTNTWASAQVSMNVSPIPMLNISPGVGAAMWNQAGSSVGGPMASVSAGFYPIALPVAINVEAGAAYLNGSLSLPYSAGVKLSLFPFTALVARYRGWEGSALRASGPEIGAEIGF